MAAWYSLLIVLGMSLFVYLGAGLLGLQAIFGIVIPYAAILVFLIGFTVRIVDWARSPVPFRIPTTAGQQKTLDWIKPSKIDSPYTTWGVVGRMALEVLFFRSLFRNTKMSLTEGKLVYGSEKWLWLGGIVFHYSFLLIVIRHLRFFTEPVPFFVQALENVDGMLQIGSPALYMTDIFLVAALLFLLLRRFYDSQMRYISQAADYFPLFLILGIALSGILMRYFTKVDLMGVKVLAMGLATFNPTVPDGLGAMFYIHLFLFCALLAYFPFSKLMHLGGVFLSPSRNLPNDSRMVRHVNPWNAPVKVHSYDHYEDDFREKMIEADIPVEKQP
ncbi:putative sulfite reductase-associated electron transfer protein DsrM [Desulfonatronum thiosulfatophilum]|uniref:Putative sulfite reductase-associated electron transfer protein DsrM n=1 Tax=Desulfonatronum thiosulfatophilum TaxID=617002 RepID=A0A1G6D6R0_9BACT|nr:sulfate reduction electron transfer complex DsrMKJOP subunit DsrM [Desulfonatronum thiosulfatophilum]SDB40847.1 putative sulfite reductase-associated electron transfer protein DsrM [Desulfonatronum thiosulfatophilum]